MFQTFDLISDRSHGVVRLAALRKALGTRGVDGFLVPRADQHQGEYVPPGAERLAWLTGFTGSAGLAAILPDRAAIFVDGRYTLQVRQQVDIEAFTPEHLIERPLSDWLADHLTSGQRLGFDPWLHTVRAAQKIRVACEKAGADLVPLTPNPLDGVWSDRPRDPSGAISQHPDDLAGQPANEKIERITAAVADLPADAFVLTQPDSIAWLLNIRGSDVPHAPLPLSFAVLRATGAVAYFVDATKLSNEVRAYLEDLGDVFPAAEFETQLGQLGATDARVALDPDWTSDAVRSILQDAGGLIVETADPVRLPKARKNCAEIAGARAAHLRDGVAMVRFLCWLDQHAPTGTVDEISAVEKLENFRAQSGRLKDISFETISGAGPNGAVIHYRVSTASNSPLKLGSLYLVDSGAQYADGTTDVTRTVAIGSASAEMRNRFTLVLKGHIALAQARFPVGTTGAQLDSLARIALWKAGLDYDHGTGHGVGSYLSVHEGPQRIAKTGKSAMEAGMIVSNEPGYYRAGAFGIRIENLELVHRAREIEGGDRAMMGFETLTLVPIDSRLIEASALTREEVSWVNCYHRRVREAIGPHLDSDDATWLTKATRPIG